MTNITADMVKELRELTGAGMMECKKALVTSNGDIKAAIKAMRESGIAKAAKKAGRIAAEGNVVVKTSADGKYAIVVEINCETDFVARDSNFLSFVDLVAQTALENKIVDVTKLSELTSANTQFTIEQTRLELVTKLGENVQIRRVAEVKSDGIIGTYVHGGRIGVAVAVTAPNVELAKDLAMHIAASNPVVINPADVPADLIAQEKEIFKAQSAESGKPADIIEKMIEGRIKKYLGEVSLKGQAFVKDPSITVASLLDKAKVDVTSFVRFEVGEGIEKPIEDFAKAVMEQAGGGT